MVFIKMLVTADNGDNDLTLIIEIMLMGVGVGGAIPKVWKHW